MKRKKIYRNNENENKTTKKKKKIEFVFYKLKNVK